MVFSQNEIIIMIGVVSVLLLCITILTILDIKEYLKAKKSVSFSENEFKEEYQEELVKPEPVQVIYKENEKNDVLVPETSNGNDEIFFEEMEDEKFDIQKENSSIIQEIKEDTSEILEKENPYQVSKVEEETIEPVVEKKEKKRLEILEELEELEERLPNKLDDVTNFEMEQERTAIISLDELMKKSDELYSDNEFVQYDDGNEPITIDEVIRRFREESEPVKVDLKEDVSKIPDVMQEIIDDNKTVQKEMVPFISNVYGIEKDNHALEFENTATYEKLERQNYNDFMAKLREMNEKE